MAKTENALRRFRRKAHLTQEELGKRCGVSKSCVCVHERKGIKTIRLARRYAAELNCDPLELLS